MLCELWRRAAFASSRGQVYRQCAVLGWYSEWLKVKQPSMGGGRPGCSCQRSFGQSKHARKSPASGLVPMPSSRRWDVTRLRESVVSSSLILFLADSASRQHPALRRAQVPGNTLQMCMGGKTMLSPGLALPSYAQDCVWGPWSSWGDCPPCGGQRYRHRNIDIMPYSGCNGLLTSSA